VSARRAVRRGAAAAELALLGTLMAFILVASTDFARVFYAYLTITQCARNGAVYGSQDATYAAKTSEIKNAAIKDGGSLSPALTTSNVSNPTIGTDADGNSTISVTVTYTFTTLVAYPGIPSSTSLSRTVEMRVCPDVPSS
jgi:Flp pilus assembly protein TadG